MTNGSAPPSVIARRVSRGTLRIPRREKLQIEGGRSKMAGAECEVHPAMHAPDGGYHGGYERMVKGRPVGGRRDSARFAPGHGRHILLLKRHAGQAVCWLNKELMPR